MSSPAAAAESLVDPLAASRPAGLWRDTLGNIVRQRNARIGLSILGLLVFAAVFADLLSAYDPDKVLFDQGIKRLTAPCVHVLGCPAATQEHLFGIDANGRDEFSRVLHGARISLQVGIVTVGLAIVIGALLGLIAGYAGGRLESAIMRTMDVLLVFPALLPRDRDRRRRLGRA